MTLVLLGLICIGAIFSNSFERSSSKSYFTLWNWNYKKKISYSKPNFFILNGLVCVFVW